MVRLQTLDRNNAESFRHLARSLRYLACFGVATLLLITGTVANAAPERINGASAIAQASATIARPAAIRTAALESHGGWDAEAAGTDIAPIGESRRDCASDDLENCGLVVFDMP